MAWNDTEKYVNKNEPSASKSFVQAPELSDLNEDTPEKLTPNRENDLIESPCLDETSLKVQDSLISTWTVKEVCKFIAEILGTNEYNDDFASQEIDGSALILLKEKHLVNAMNMKLGPALKIVAKVQSLLNLNPEASASTTS